MQHLQKFKKSETWTILNPLDFTISHLSALIWCYTVKKFGLFDISSFKICKLRDVFWQFGVSVDMIEFQLIWIVSTYTVSSLGVDTMIQINWNSIMLIETPNCQGTSGSLNILKLEMSNNPNFLQWLV